MHICGDFIFSQPENASAAVCISSAELACCYDFCTQGSKKIALGPAPEIGSIAAYRSPLNA